MADTTGNTKGGNEKAVDLEGVGDRVEMLSLRADGTPDQLNPTLINVETTADATRKQFREQAVSAADVVARTPEAPDEADTGASDPQVQELQKTHTAAEKQAGSAADAALKKLGES